MKNAATESNSVAAFFVYGLPFNQAIAVGVLKFIGNGGTSFS